jgi:hypothetical protein
LIMSESQDNLPKNLQDFPDNAAGAVARIDEGIKSWCPSGGSGGLGEFATLSSEFATRVCQAENPAFDGNQRCTKGLPPNRVRVRHFATARATWSAAAW